MRAARPTPTKHLFAVGHIAPRKCRIGSHVGPMVDAERFLAAPDPMWHSQVTCAHCGSTVERATIRGEAA